MWKMNPLVRLPYIPLFGGSTHHFWAGSPGVARLLGAPKQNQPPEIPSFKRHIRADASDNQTRGTRSHGWVDTFVWCMAIILREALLQKWQPNVQERVTC